MCIRDRNVNSAATVRLTPIKSAPMIVAPDLDVPGTIANTWNKPMINAVVYVISFKEFTYAVLHLFHFSITIKMIP